jgi:hypothetical protein
MSLRVYSTSTIEAGGTLSVVHSGQVGCYAMTYAMDERFGVVDLIVVIKWVRFVVGHRERRTQVCSRGTVTTRSDIEQERRQTRSLIKGSAP